MIASEFQRSRVRNAQQMHKLMREVIVCWRLSALTLVFLVSLQVGLVQNEGGTALSNKQAEVSRLREKIVRMTDVVFVTLLDNLFILVLPMFRS